MYDGARNRTDQTLHMWVRLTLMRMNPIVRGQYSYEIIEGHDDIPTKVKVSRVDKGQIDETETEEKMAGLARAFPSERFYLSYPMADVSGEYFLVIVGLSLTGRRRTNSPLGVRSAVRRDEVEPRLKSMPNE